MAQPPPRTRRLPQHHRGRHVIAHHPLIAAILYTSDEACSSSQLRPQLRPQPLRSRSESVCRRRYWPLYPGCITTRFETGTRRRKEGSSNDARIQHHEISPFPVEPKYLMETTITNAREDVRSVRVRDDSSDRKLGRQRSHSRCHDRSRHLVAG